MYNEQIEGLISAALADGVLTEKEKQILFKKAQSQGIDLDEFEMVLDARLVELQKAEKEKAAKSAPKSDKYGTVRKCPACGAIVPAFQGVCPECGHEFMDVDANASSKKLAEQLLKENNTNKQKQIIETFPLPNTKADLLEFLTALKPRINDAKDPLSKSYFKKYQECIEKAKVTFPNDKLIAPFIAEHDKIVSKLKRDSTINSVMLIVKKYWYIIAAVLVALVILIINFPTTKNNSDNCNRAIEKALANKNPEKAAKYAYEYNAYKGSISKNVERIIIEFLAQEQIHEAEKIYLYFENELHHRCDALVGYYLSKDDVEKAKKYIGKTEQNDIIEKYLLEKHEYHKAWQSASKDKFNLKSYLEYICKNNSKDAARKFLNQHIDEISECNLDRLFYSKEEDRIESAANKKAILKDLNSFINNY